VNSGYWIHTARSDRRQHDWLQVSPRTVRKYLSRAPTGCPRGDQRWSRFLKNHAQAIVACDFFVTVTCSFRLLHVFVVMDHRSRRLIHCNVTAHPSALWTRQQLREAFGYETGDQ
jgi:putative transposase